MLLSCGPLSRKASLSTPDTLSHLQHIVKLWASCLSPWQSRARGRPWASVFILPVIFAKQIRNPPKSTAIKQLKHFITDWKVSFWQYKWLVNNSIQNVWQWMDIYQRVIEQPKMSSRPLFTPAATADKATNAGNSRLRNWRPCPDSHTPTHPPWVPSNPASWSDSPALIELIPTSGSTVPRGLTLHSVRLQLSPSKASD